MESNNIWATKDFLTNTKDRSMKTERDAGSGDGLKIITGFTKDNLKMICQMVSVDSFTTTDATISVNTKITTDLAVACT